MTHVISFGVPIHESVEGHAFMALSQTWAAWRDIAPPGWRLKVGVSRGCSIVENRNRIATELLRDGFELDGRSIPGQDAPRSPLSTRPADVIVWNDSDCLVEPEEYVRLVESLLAAPPDVGAIGYAFPMQSADRPRPNVGRAAGPVTFAAPGPVSLVEVDWIGFGVVATRAEVYRAMGEPTSCCMAFCRSMAKPGRECCEEHDGEAEGPRQPFDGPWFSHSTGTDGRGEDIGWCRDVRAMGYKILCDVGVLGTHCYRAPHTLRTFYDSNHRED